MENSCIHASDVFTLLYFLLSIVLLPIGYTYYKQFAETDYADKEAKNTYLKYLVSFFCCSIVFVLFLFFVVKGDYFKPILISVNTLTLMGVLFSGLAQHTMKPFTTFIAINLSVSILCFMFYVYKIIKANPNSTKNFTQGATMVGKGALSGIEKGYTNVKDRTNKALNSQTAKNFSKNMSQFGSKAIQSTGSGFKTVADNLKKGYKPQNLNQLGEKFKTTGAAKVSKQMGQSTKQGYNKVVDNLKKGYKPQNLNQLGQKFKTTGATKVLKQMGQSTKQ
jgi:hypothetical protein